MDESRKPIEEPNLDNLFTYIEGIIAPWKEMERQIADIHPDADDGFANGDWSNSLKRFFLWQTICMKDCLQGLSKNRNN